MADTEDLADAIDTAAREPKRVTEGQSTIEQQPLSELIAADQYLAGKRAQNAGRLGPTYARFVPPGTQGS